MSEPLNVHEKKNSMSFEVNVADNAAASPAKPELPEHLKAKLDSTPSKSTSAEDVARKMEAAETRRKSKLENVAAAAQAKNAKIDEVKKKADAVSEEEKAKIAAEIAAHLSEAEERRNKALAEKAAFAQEDIAKAAVAASNADPNNPAPHTHAEAMAAAPPS